MREMVLSLIAAGVIACSTYAHGLWTLRWTGPAQLAAAGAKVELIPQTFGDWSGEDLKVEKRAMDQAGAYGYLSRRYVNRANGRTMTIMFLCGQTGPLAAHLPTVCFPGTGMDLVSQEKKISVRRDES
ncbi:MAG TPA: exosortase-associated EpsI family protein, partial [Planctomycetaceae bacterium]|nr:exosortase-associated EpsI family protein [Planctomycetaceae bacterium]